jgi:hypothetical protein
MKNIFNNLQKPNMAFLVTGIVYTIVYFVNFQTVWLVLGLCFLTLSFVIKTKP